MKILPLIFMLFSVFLFGQKKCGFVNGLQEGNCLFFYENGQKKWDQQWKKGKLDGDYLAYFENGKLKAQGSYKKGLKVGEWNYYDDKGLKTGVEKHGNWRGDTFIDNCEVIYYENGKPSSSEKGQYINGLEEGKWIAFYLSGKKYSEVNYVNGKKEGEAQYFREDGSFEKTKLFKDGEEVVPKVDPKPTVTEKEEISKPKNKPKKVK